MARGRWLDGREQGGGLATWRKGLPNESEVTAKLVEDGEEVEVIGTRGSQALGRPLTGGLGGGWMGWPEGWVLMIGSKGGGTVGSGALGRGRSEAGWMEWGGQLWKLGEGLGSWMEGGRVNVDPLGSKREGGMAKGGSPEMMVIGAAGDGWWRLSTVARKMVALMGGVLREMRMAGQKLMVGGDGGRGFGGIGSQVSLARQGWDLREVFREAEREIKRKRMEK